MVRPAQRRVLPLPALDLKMLTDLRPDEQHGSPRVLGGMVIVDLLSVLLEPCVVYVEPIPSRSHPRRARELLARYERPTSRRRNRASRLLAARPSGRSTISRTSGSRRRGTVTAGSSSRAAPAARTCHPWTACAAG
jgi:hypothetical protein